MPFVRWRLGAVELTPEDSPPIGKNILQLTDVRETATYTCVATSDLGNIEYDAEVRVKGTPTLGTNSSLLFVTCTTRMLPSIDDRGQTDRVTMRAADCSA